jgi:anti-sigma B factor antagonist
MAVTERQVGDVTVVDLIGRLTLTDNAGRLKDKVRRLLLEGRSRIVLNLEETAYIDSTGLGEIVAAYTAAAKAGGAMKVANPGPRLRNLLVTTRLLTAFDCFDSTDDAVKSFFEPRA